MSKYPKVIITAEMPTAIQFVYRVSVDRTKASENVAKYIMNHETHHKKKTFQEENIELLQRFNIEYDKRYILKDIGE